MDRYIIPKRDFMDPADVQGAGKEPILTSLRTHKTC